MTPVLIDFSGAPPRPPGWALAVLAVGLAICIAAVWRVSDLTMREDRAAGDVERARAAVAARQPAAVPPVTVPEAQVAAINRAIIELNLPWQALFHSIEEAKPKNIAILGLEPNGEKRTLRIFAEAKQPEDMLDFVRLLRGQPQFSEAVLVKHEVYIQDPNRPLRFTVEALWKATL